MSVVLFAFLVIVTAVFTEGWNPKRVNCFTDIWNVRKALPSQLLDIYEFCPIATVVASSGERTGKGF